MRTKAHMKLGELIDEFVRIEGMTRMLAVGGEAMVTASAIEPDRSAFAWQATFLQERLAAFGEGLEELELRLARSET